MANDPTFLTLMVNAAAVGTAWFAGEAGRNQVSNAVFGLEGDVMALHSKATATLHQYRVEQR